MDDHGFGEVHLINLRPYADNDSLSPTKLSAEVKLTYIRDHLSSLVSDPKIDVHDAMDMKVVKVSIEYTVEELK